MRITTAQRRERLAQRLMLRPEHRVERTEEVAERLVGLHATDAATVVLSAWARLREPRLSDVERALYENRTLTRMHCMRRTLFVVPAELVPVFHFSTAVDVAARERAWLLRHLAATGTGRDETWLVAAEEAAWECVAALGEASAAEVMERVSMLRETVTMSPGKRYESRQRVGGWVLRLLAMEGRLRRGRQVGGWTSGQFRYTVTPEMPVVERDEAQAEVVRRWLATYGPGTTADIAWWTGWRVSEVRQALRRVGAVEVELDEGTGWVLPDDDATAPEVDDWVALLPGLDPATMGWKRRDWYLDPTLRARVFDSAGNGGPTVWWNGEIVGVWAQRRDGTVVWRLLVDRGAEARAAVAAEAARLQEWLAAHELVASFPAPMTKELVS